MVPKDRIELSADPYQGSVLPLNYIGKKERTISLLLYSNILFFFLKVFFLFLFMAFSLVASL